MGLRERVHPKWLAATAFVMGVAAVSGATLSSLSTGSLPAAGPAAPLSADELLDAFGTYDSDRDGLADSLENYRYGTDPMRWNTTGGPLPDGWLARNGYDPLEPGASQLHGEVPPREAWPPFAQENYVDSYRPSLWQVYSFGRPPDWEESRDGPWESGLDPRDWDSNDDGVPDGFLLRHGLDPRTTGADEKPAGEGGLTVREAYLHGTDPTGLDFDRDGLRDRVEIEGAPDPTRLGIRFKPTNPRLYSSTLQGVCDGFLVAHGLDPNGPDVPQSDPDRDGASTRDEFAWSVDREPRACETGAGLDPRDAQTGDAGIADGWLLRYGLDPLAPGVAGRTTQRASTDPSPRPLNASADVVLTVRAEYETNRPEQWVEGDSGPWWGGSDPNRTDTDADGLGDAWEFAGYQIAVATEVGEAKAELLRVRSDPTQPDSDGDGLSDLAEAVGSSGRSTHASRRDTDLDSLPDGAELAVAGLDPARADTAGDLLPDGVRLRLLVDKAATYSANDTYPWPGKPGDVRKVSTWLAGVAGAKNLGPLTPEKVRAFVGPAGDIDGDGRPNLIDPDIDGDGLLNGWEHDPRLYSRSSFGTGNLPGGRPPSDPLNPDTDGDGLLDGWEVKYALPDLQLGLLVPDPTRWDTDSDGVPDGEEDPDDDGIAWFSYDVLPSGTRAVENRFAFTNLMEQEAETDPNRQSSDDDQLLDGWKAFWGTEYPNLTPGGNPDPGDLYPGGPDGPLETDATRAPAVGLKQSGVNLAPSPLVTHRFAILGSGPAGLLRANETTGQIFVDVQRQDGSKQDIVEIIGTWPYTFIDAQAAATNVYMDDSDGDGLPDHWEWVQRAVPPHGTCRPDGGPNPTLPDATNDPDGDRLSNAVEHALGTHPLCPDHDQGGLTDGDEVDLGTNPGDPTDDFIEDGRDRDGDGLTDLTERVEHGTSPLDPDTDGDGLLDGRNVPRTGGLLQTDAAARRLMDLGVAYVTSDGPQGRVFTFLGELDLSTDPLDADPGRTGVPQGWLVAHGLDPAGSEVDADTSQGYALGKPSWWRESDHGVWWGGARPSELGATAQISLQDVDADGLGDLNGEDPYPFANHYNVPRTIDWTAHGLSRPAEEDPGASGLTAPERHLLAQSWVNPRVVGPQRYTREPDPEGLQDDGTHSPRGRPALEGVAANASSLERGGALQVSGWLRLDSEPVSGITIVLEMAGLPVGAAFTDAEGRFSARAELSALHEATMPGGAFALMGTGGGTVRWSVDPAQIPLGATALRVRSYATPATVPHTTQWPPLERTVQDLPVTVRARPTISVLAPPQITTGEPTSLDVRVVDASGAPVREPVRLSLPFATLNATPDQTGTANFRFTVPHGSAGPLPIRLAVLPASEWVVPVTRESSLEALRPAALEASATSPITAGGALEVRGRATAPTGPIPGAHLRVALGETVVPAKTGPDGSFRAAFVAPADLPAGSHPVLVELERGSHWTGGAKTIIVEVLGRPIIEMDAEPLRLGQAANVSGRLLSSGGRPLAGVALAYDLGGQSGVARTAADGRFKGEARLERVGAVEQRVWFSGDSTHIAWTESVQRTVVSATALQVASASVARGSQAQVEARLVDELGRPVGGAPITIQWQGREAQSGVTDPQGLLRVLQGTDPLAAPRSFGVTAWFNGSADGTLLASKAEAVWNVLALVQFRLEGTAVAAGSPSPRAQMVEAGTGKPLAGMAVTVQIGRSTKEMVTDSVGFFKAIPDYPVDEPAGPREVALRFLGSGHYPSLAKRFAIEVRSPTTLRVDVAPLIRTSHQTLPFQLLDGGARGVNGTVQAELDGLRIGEGRCLNGIGVLRVTVPAGHPVGNGSLRVWFEGDARYLGSEVQQVVSVLRSASIDVVVERSQDQNLSRVLVSTLSEGEPVPFATVRLSVEGTVGGMLAETDESGSAVFLVQSPPDGQALAAVLEGGEGRAAARTTARLAPLETAVAPEETAVWPWVLGAVLLVAVAAAAVLWRRRGGVLESAVVEARQAVLARGPVEAAILAAYRILEQASLSSGWLDARAVTARSLQTAIQPRLPPSVHGDLDRLVKLFEEARYGEAPMTPPHRQRALHALSRIRAAVAWRGTS